MTKLADDPRVATSGSEPDVGRELTELAERMRGTVTPVVGYLELISQDGSAVPPERYLNWISTIERRLDAIRETSDQISKVCDVLRQSVSDRDRSASTPPAPEAPAG